MAKVNQPDDLGRVLADFERRIRTLETAQRLTKASITDDAGNELVRLSRDGLTVFDSDGDDRVTLGLIDATPHYGLVIRDDDGATERLRIDERGVLTPYLSAPLVDADSDFKVVTSGAFVATHRAQFEIITHQGLYCWVTALTTDGSTTGEMRLRNVGTGAVTDAFSIPAAGGGVLKQFRWLHGSALSAGPQTFEVQARRTAGAGNVQIYRAPGMWMTNPGLCTEGGAP